MNYLVTAIGTDSGKTVIASALALALNADYWKPVQAGYPTDSETVKKLTGGKTTIHGEKYVFKTPASPHYAAVVDNVIVSLSDFQLPKTDRSLIVEGAGGCLVPMNNDNFIIDLARELDLEILLVSNNYLGSINHTLLTLEYLKKNDFPLKGVIFNGPENKSTEDIIMHHSKAPCFYKVREMEEISVKSIYHLAEKFKTRWNELGW